MTTTEESFLRSRQLRMGGSNRRNDDENSNDDIMIINKRRNQKEMIQHRFWISFHNWMKQWKQSLEKLIVISASTTNDKNKDDNINNNDEKIKRNLQLKFNQLSQQLKDFRKHCLLLSLSTISLLSSLSFAIVDLDERNDKDGSFITMLLNYNNMMKKGSKRNDDDDCIILLSSNDLRLMHKEFETCQEKYQTIRSQLLPKGKFIFQRYRMAMEQKKLQQEQHEHHTLNHVPTLHGTIEKAHDHSPLIENDNNNVVDDFNPIIVGYNNMSIAIHPAVVRNSNEKEREDEFNDWIITTTTGSHNNTSTDNNNNNIITCCLDDIIKRKVLSSSSLVLKNLEFCNIHCSPYLYNCPSLHMDHVNHSHIFIYQNILGSIHITKCHHTTIYMIEQHVHQLRIHESNHLQIYLLHSLSSTNTTNNTTLTNNNENNIIIPHQNVTVTSGIILEECKQIHFFHKPVTNNQQQQLDVKDFDWLRNNVPSPNYTMNEIDDDEYEQFSKRFHRINDQNDDEDQSMKETIETMALTSSIDPVQKEQQSSLQAATSDLHSTSVTSQMTENTHPKGSIDDHDKDDEDYEEEL